MIGLKHGTVALFPHESEWEKEAETTAQKLKNILGDSAVDIQHIGSTAIKTIAAKPIIDLAVGVKSFDDIMKYENELKENGFYLRNSKIDNQLLFACGSYYDGTGDVQTHFIHVVIYGGREWNNYIGFRDYLNENEEAAKQYETLKIRLASECPEDEGRVNYTNGKHSFITEILDKINSKRNLTVPFDDGFINIRVGAIIMRNGKFLMVKSSAPYLYSVGGRIQFGESAEEAVVREVEEETGTKMEIDRLGFVEENFFIGDGKKTYGKTIYEISFYFYMKTPENFEPVCDSSNSDSIKENLVWISPDEETEYFPKFFRTELKNSTREIRHIVTDERKN